MLGGAAQGGRRQAAVAGQIPGVKAQQKAQTIGLRAGALARGKQLQDHLGILARQAEAHAGKLIGRHKGGIQCHAALQVGGQQGIVVAVHAAVAEMIDGGQQQDVGGKFGESEAQQPQVGYRWQLRRCLRRRLWRRLWRRLRRHLQLHWQHQLAVQAKAAQHAQQADGRQL